MAKNEPKSLEARLKAGELFDIASACRQTGYSYQHLTKLCRMRMVTCIQRGRAYFFTADHISKMFKVVKSR